MSNPIDFEAVEKFCNELIRFAFAEKTKLAQMHKEIEANATHLMDALYARSNKIIDELQEKGPSQKNTITIITMKMTTLYQMNDGLQQDVQKRMVDCDRLRASAESLQQSLKSARNKNTSANVSQIEKKLDDVNQLYQFIYKSRAMFHKRYDLFNMVYRKAWKEFGLYGKHAPNSSGKQGSLTKNALNKLRQSYKSKPYATSLESVHENENVSGGKRRPKRTLRKRA